jgi:hypothetical protein
MEAGPRKWCPNATVLLKELFELGLKFLLKNCKEILNNINNNFIGQLLQHHSLKSTKYVKWLKQKIIRMILLL